MTRKKIVFPSASAHNSQSQVTIIRGSSSPEQTQPPHRRAWRQVAPAALPATPPPEGDYIGGGALVSFGMGRVSERLHTGMRRLRRRISVGGSFWVSVVGAACGVGVGQGVEVRVGAHLSLGGGGRVREHEQLRPGGARLLKRRADGMQTERQHGLKWQGLKTIQGGRGRSGLPHTLTHLSHLSRTTKTMGPVGYKGTQRRRTASRIPQRADRASGYPVCVCVQLPCLWGIARRPREGQS